MDLDDESGDVFEEQLQQQGESDPDLLEAENRLREVDYYKALEGAEIFGDQPDEIAQRVLERLREWTRQQRRAILRPGAGPTAGLGPEERQRLGALLAINAEGIAVLKALAERIAAEPQFLKVLMAKVLDRPKLAPVVTPVAAPVRRVTPVAPAAAPASTTRGAPPPPARRNVPQKQPAVTPPATPGRKPPAEKVRPGRAVGRHPDHVPMPRGEDMTSATQRIADAGTRMGIRRIAGQITSKEEGTTNVGQPGEGAPPPPESD